MLTELHQYRSNRCISPSVCTNIFFFLSEPLPAFRQTSRKKSLLLLFFLSSLNQSMDTYALTMLIRRFFAHFQIIFIAFQQQAHSALISIHIIPALSNEVMQSQYSMLLASSPHSIVRKQRRTFRFFVVVVEK